MKIKDKVAYWLKYDDSLKDDDNRLCSNIWASEIKESGLQLNSTITEFLKLYAKNKLSPATSISRARAKLQEQFPEFRGKSYYLRQGRMQDIWLEELGYEKNK